MRRLHSAISSHSSLYHSCNALELSAMSANSKPVLMEKIRQLMARLSAMESGRCWTNRGNSCQPKFLFFSICIPAGPASYPYVSSPHWISQDPNRVRKSRTSWFTSTIGDGANWHDWHLRLWICLLWTSGLLITRSGWKWSQVGKGGIQGHYSLTRLSICRDPLGSAPCAGGQWKKSGTKCQYCTVPGAPAW